MPSDVETREAPRWTDTLPKTNHVQYFKETNWSQTPLGSLGSWPISLRQMVGVLMSDSRVTSLMWYELLRLV